ncbi:thiol-disulfide oxidoreductase [Burkholderiaceae bacterium]|jgi:peroxiredoxin
MRSFNSTRTFIFFIISLFISIPSAWGLSVGEHLNVDKLLTVEGRLLAASDLKGKYLVVQVWATWCPYCHRQNANLKELVRRTQGGNLLVIGLSVDKKEETVQNYVKKNEINFPVAMMTPELDQAIGKRRGIPELYVIDPSGRVLQKDFGQMVDLDVFELARFNRR